MARKFLFENYLRLLTLLSWFKYQCAYKNISFSLLLISFSGYESTSQLLATPEMKRGSTLLPPNHIYQKAMALNVYISFVIIFLNEVLLALNINEAIVPHAIFSSKKQCMWNMYRPGNVTISCRLMIMTLISSFV